MSHPAREVTLKLSFEAIAAPDMAGLVEELRQRGMICARPVWSAEIDHVPAA